MADGFPDVSFLTPQSHQALSKKVNVASDRHAAGLREVEAKVAGVEAKLAASEERLQSAVDGVEQEVTGGDGASGEVVDSTSVSPTPARPKAPVMPPRSVDDEIDEASGCTPSSASLVDHL